MSAVTEVHDGHAEHPAMTKWSHDQRRLAGMIAGGFVVGVIMAGVIGPIVLTIVIGLLQGYSA